MTRKNEKKEEKMKESGSSDKPKNNNSNNNLNDAETQTEEIEDKSIFKESTEIKKIEGQEPRKLEYFSKDELIEKSQELEKKVNESKEKITQLQKQAEDWKNKYTRLQAEFENAQKRWDKNRQNLRLQYNASTIKSFLPLYDSFKKALENDNGNSTQIKGFYDQFMNILKSYKAEPIKPKINDPFDYNLHDALSSIEKDDLPNNTIVEVVQDGWKLDKEVIRYAKVIVSRKPKPPEPEPEKKEEKEEADEKKEHKQTEEEEEALVEPKEETQKEEKD